MTFELIEQPVHNPVVEKTVFDNNKGNQSWKCSQIKGPKARGEKMGQWQVIKYYYYIGKKKPKTKKSNPNKQKWGERAVIVARRKSCPEWVGGHGRVRRTARRWFWKAELSSQGQLGRQVRAPYFHQIDEDTEVSNSHVPIQELLFMNLETDNRSQSQPNTSSAFPLTQLVHYPFFRDVATSSLIRGSHILWRHQSTSQQISYCQVGKSFCWPSHLWLLSLWVAPVYSALTGRLPRPIASQTGLVLFKPCGK